MSGKMKLRRRLWIIWSAVLFIYLLRVYHFTTVEHAIPNITLRQKVIFCSVLAVFHIIIFALAYFIKSRAITRSVVADKIDLESPGGRTKVTLTSIVVWAMVLSCGFSALTVYGVTGSFISSMGFFLISVFACILSAPTRSYLEGYRTTAVHEQDHPA